MMDDYQKYIHISRYARHIWGENRRETWAETVERYFDFFEGKLGPELVNRSPIADARIAVHNMEVMPSMRALMTAGDALAIDNVAGYNCAYLTIDSVRAFDELMYILMCGTGVGFSVERKYVDQLPGIPDKIYPTDTTIVVADSKLGWASSFRELLALLYAGKRPKWNLERVRGAGEPLKTFGGRASGPAPLAELFEFTARLIEGAGGRKLRPLECHDLCCKIASVVVVGGVRRSALISLSDATDQQLARAKTGDWFVNHDYRSYANNSAVYGSKPYLDFFMREWENLYVGESGERGIFNRKATCETVRRNGRREPDHLFGTNPCSEIILRDKQFCNLTEVIVRPGDTINDLKGKVEIATILGTVQATLTDFRYLRGSWRKNCEEERLLGVSLTGIMDHNHLSGREKRGDLEKTLELLREHAVETNDKWARILGINASTAITCVKPSGTVSQLCDTASGIHPRHSPFYIRRTLLSSSDPLAIFLKEQGFQCHQSTKPDHLVFEFPRKAPTGSQHLSPLAQLELWKTYATSWCEHKPSMTCYYTESTFLDIGSWVWKNWDHVNGISFFPKSDHIYTDAPYEEITKKQYTQLLSNQPEKVNWNEFREYTDLTTSSQEFACTGDKCDL